MLQKEGQAVEWLKKQAMNHLIINGQRFNKYKDPTLWNSKNLVCGGVKLTLEESRKFTLFSRCICAHFGRHFKHIKTDDIYRVIVKLSEPDERNGTIKESNSVLKYYKKSNSKSNRTVMLTASMLTASFYMPTLPIRPISLVAR